MNKVLIIEDEPELAKAIKIKLEKEGFEIDTAENGKAGWDLVEKTKVDCIILDIVMPHTDGVWFLKKLRQDPKKTKIPVIVFTNLSEGEKVSKIVALGEYRLLVKAETSLETLVNTVKEVIRLYH
jgi:DNA-binding response OmpR family regulator